VSPTPSLRFNTLHPVHVLVHVHVCNKSTPAMDPESLTNRTCNTLISGCESISMSSVVLGCCMQLDIEENHNSDVDVCY
jgi:hypothetical protein